MKPGLYFIEFVIFTETVLSVETIVSMESLSGSPTPFDAIEKILKFYLCFYSRRGRRVL